MIQITDQAAAHISKMLAKRSLGEKGLRVGVKAGGCAGLEYTFGWDVKPKPGDAIFSATDGGQVFVDPKSLRFLEGSVLDYDASLLSKGFVISNPRATGTCGCGVSFTIDDSIPETRVVHGEVEGKDA